MFNPYFARPIGSEQFERHLLTLMEKGEQEAKEAAEVLHEIPISLKVEEHDPVRWDPVDECWKLLALMVKAQAILDYLDEYEHRLRCEDRGDFASAEVHESRCLTMENEYFRQTDEGEWMIDSLLREVIHNDRDCYLKQRMCRIRNTQHRISAWIWTVQARENGGRRRKST